MQTRHRFRGQRAVNSQTPEFTARLCCQNQRDNSQRNSLFPSPPLIGLSIAPPSPRLKLRLHQPDQMASGPQQRPDHREHQTQGNERHINHNSVEILLRKLYILQILHIRLLDIHHSRVPEQPVVQLPSADIQANHTCSSVLPCTIREATRRSTHVQDHSTCEMQTEPQNCGFQLQSAATDIKWLLRHLQQFFG